MPRNTNGNYTLPSGNPVIPGTLIETDWANPTMADIAAALTDSLSRKGDGGMLSSFKIADGIVTAPGIAFGSEPSTGMWKPGSATLAFSVAGVEALRMNATTIALNKAVTVTGNLTVAGAISLAGAVAMAGPLTVDNGVINTSGQMQFQAAGGFVFNNTVRVNANESSAAAITLQGNSVNSSVISGYANNGTSLMGQVVWRDNEMLLYSSAAMTFFGGPVVGPVERMRISPLGSVGIGTVNPLATLHVENDGFLQLLVRGNQAVRTAGISLRNEQNLSTRALDIFYGGSAFVSGEGSYLFSTGAFPLVLGTSNVERMRIDAAGKVGIGRTPGEMLDVAGMVRSIGTVNFRAINATFNNGGSFTAVAGGGAGVRLSSDSGPVMIAPGDIERLRIGPTGNVDAMGMIRATGWYDDAIGSVNAAAVEIGVASDQGNILAYRRAAPVGYKNLNIDGASINLRASGTVVVGITAGGLVTVGDVPTPAAALHIRSAAETLVQLQRTVSTGAFWMKLANDGGTSYIGLDDSTGGRLWGQPYALSIGTEAARPLVFATGNVLRAMISGTGVFTYGGNEIGYRKVPLIHYVGASTLQLVDRGCAHEKTDASQTTVPANVFTGGDVVTIYNWSVSAMTIVPGAGLTMYLAGTAVSSGNRTLAGVGVATVLFRDVNTAVISGAGLS